MIKAGDKGCEIGSRQKMRVGAANALARVGRRRAAGSIRRIGKK
jgi:hypothetical protein